MKYEEIWKICFFKKKIKTAPYLFSSIRYICLQSAIRLLITFKYSSWLFSIIFLFLIAGESVPALRANLDFYRYIIYISIYVYCWTVQKFIFKEKLLRSSASFLCTLAGSVLLGIDIKCIKFKVSLEYGMVEPYGFVPKCHTWVFHFCMKIWLDIMGQLIWFCFLSDLLSLMSRTKYHHQPSYFLNHLFA